MNDWKFTNVHHTFRRNAGISFNEYGFLDLIYQSQSHPKSRTDDGFATISYQELSDFLGLSKGTMHLIATRMQSAGLFEICEDDPKKKRTTALWYDNAYIDSESKIKEAAKKVSVQKMNAKRSENERSENERLRSENERLRSENERPTLVYKEIKERNEYMGPPDQITEADILDFQEQEDDPAIVYIAVDETETPPPHSAAPPSPDSGLPPEEQRILNAVEAATGYFDRYPAMIDLCREASKDVAVTENEVYEQLALWVRYHGNEAYFLNNITKNISSSFVRWMANFKRFQPKKINDTQYGKSGNREKIEVFSDDDLRRAYENLKSEGYTDNSRRVQCNTGPMPGYY